ncbi:MAG: mechanosensitive ion channel [Sulfurovum sp.]
MKFFGIVSLFIISFGIGWADGFKKEQNITASLIDNNITRLYKIKRLVESKDKIEKELINNHIWTKVYSNYHTYKELKKQSIRLEKKIKRLKNLRELTKKQKRQLVDYGEENSIVLDKLQLLKEYEKDPFKKFLTPPTVESMPRVDTPFAVITALSYREKLQSDIKEYNIRYISLQDIMKKFRAKKVIIIKLLKIDSENKNYETLLHDTEDEIKTFVAILDIFKTTKNVYIKKVDEIKFKLKNDIKVEVGKTMLIGGIILFLLFLLLLIKYIITRYMTDSDRSYSINKALNISFVTITIFILLFAYIKNVSYLITILGFASAGIAIAMKDWFMSIMGWITIIMGGAIHVGDRVKFTKDGVQYVGDIIDISMLRMTMQEDVTITTVNFNRRAGRIIFIPNNFIFTDVIANYSHAGLKTVWDGIDFVVTFDSDIHKASVIAKEVTRKYSKGYTDITRKQLNKLRSQYSIKNTNVEPRILTFITPYGMTISAWYLTNSYATLTLRSTISLEIINRINAEESINLAFPTQSIYIDKDVRKPAPNIDDIEIEGTHK